MAPYIIPEQRIPEEEDGVSGFFQRLWQWIVNALHTVWNWLIDTGHGINDETIEHPYLMSFALLVIWAWPHILILPVWFARDGVRRMEDHTRNFPAQVITPPPRRRRRDVFVARYRSVVNAGYTPPPPSNPALFGGTPLTEGQLNIEGERSLPLALRIIRWSALAWMVYILGREWYQVLERHT